MAEKFNTLKRVKDHYEESLEYFKPNQIVLCALQGSQNYSLDLPTSDVDTKLIVLPSFKDIVLASKPISTTHIRANDEHTDWKDILISVLIKLYINRGEINGYLYRFNK